jgi:hypothetical protein
MKCTVCGEYRGKVCANALNWNWERTEDRQRLIGVTCLCDGILCSRCKRNKIHRPITNSYDEARDAIEHWPYFSGMIPCAECQSRERADSLKTTNRQTGD